MGEYLLIPVDKIRCDGEQVRRTFREEAIDGLAQSMKEVGMLHPVLVTPLDDGTYRLVSGERRLRAAQRLREEKVPALVVRDFRGSITQVQLIENLQREDLNPIERALAIQRFLEQEKLSKAAASARLGIPRTTLTDWLDVLDLPPRYQAALLDNSMGGDSPLTLSHISEAKALAARLGSPQIAVVLLDAVLEHRLSKAETRQVAQLVRESDNLSIEQAVAIVRGGGPGLLSPVKAPRGAGQKAGDDELGDEGEPWDEEEGEAGDGGTSAGSRPAAGRTDREDRAFRRVLLALDRFRAVLAQLLGGLLRHAAPEQRTQLVEYLQTIRRWIDDVIAFAGEVDNPEAAARRRLELLKAARKRRRSSKGRLAGRSVAPEGFARAALLSRLRQDSGPDGRGHVAGSNGSVSRPEEPSDRLSVGGR